MGHNDENTGMGFCLARGVPEPTLALLLACGLVGLGWLGRRDLH
jgi:hypothetical protein